MSATLYTYTPQATPGPIGTDPRPSAGEDALTELCELDGLRYVSVPDFATVSVPEQITDWQPASLTDALRAQIKTASPHCRRIDEQVVAQIRSRYSVDDEIKLLRLAPSPETDAWNAWAEDCRAWGAAQKTALGL